MINLLYYEHWSDKWKYILYISVTHKVLKSCRSKMSTLAHDVCDVHGASSLYMKTCWQSSLIYVITYIYIYIYIYMVYIYTGFSLLGRWGESPYPATNLLIPSSSPPNFYSLPPKDNSTQQKNKKVIFSCSHCSCTIFVWISYSFLKHRSC